MKRILAWSSRWRDPTKRGVIDMIMRMEDIFPRGTVEDRIFSNVTYFNSISEKGDIRRQIRIQLRALRNGVDSLTWWVPHAGGKQPFAIEVRVDDAVVQPQMTTRKKEDGEGSIRYYTHIQVPLASMRKYQECVISITYFLRSYVKKVGRGPFHIDWELQWAYYVRSSVQYLEVRTEMPVNARVKEARPQQSLSRREDIVEFDRRQTHIVSIHNPPAGNIIGITSYRTTSPSLPTVISLIAAVPLSIAINYLTQSAFTMRELFVIIVVITTTIYAAHSLIIQI